MEERAAYPPVWQYILTDESKTVQNPANKTCE